MNRCWIKPDNFYYEGDREHALDVDVPKRPSALHIPVVTNGVFIQWIIDTSAQTEENRKTGIDSSVASSPIVQTLKSLNNTDFNAWWTTNVTTLPQASLILREVVKYIVRRI